MKTKKNSVSDFVVGEVAYAIRGENRIFGYSGIINYDATEFTITDIDIEYEGITGIDPADGLETTYGLAAVKKYEQIFHYIVDELANI